jgi:hypothetical protein
VIFEFGFLVLFQFIGFLVFSIHFFFAQIL